MKKRLSSLTLLLIISLINLSVIAQDSVPNVDSINNTETNINESDGDQNAENNSDESSTNEETFHQIIKQKFMEGGPEFMGIVLLCLILGLALSIERIIYLNMATINSDKLLNDVESALKDGGIDSAKDVCRNTRGPIASIFYQGLDRSNEGIEHVEKSIIATEVYKWGYLKKVFLGFLCLLP